MEDLGLALGHDSITKELRYLMENEFASTAKDGLWRRSTYEPYIGAEVSAEEHSALTHSIESIHSELDNPKWLDKGALNVS